MQHFTAKKLNFVNNSEHYGDEYISRCRFGHYHIKYEFDDEACWHAYRVYFYPKQEFKFMFQDIRYTGQVKYLPLCLEYHAFEATQEHFQATFETYMRNKRENKS